MQKSEQKIESIRLPRGVVVFYKLHHECSDINGTKYDDTNLELMDAFHNGQRVSCDGYDLLSEVKDEILWNSL